MSIEEIILGEWRVKASGDVAQSSGLGAEHALPCRDGARPAIYVGSQTKQLVGSLLQLFFSAHDVVTASIKYRADSLFATTAYVLHLAVDSELHVNISVCENFCICRIAYYSIFKANISRFSLRLIL